MYPPLRQSTNALSASVLLILGALAIERRVVYAQSGGSDGDPYVVYWFTPGRIVGIAIGVLVLVLLILSMLVFACRRRRYHAKAPSGAVTPSFAGAGGYPPAYPSWQDTQQTRYVPETNNAGWYYPTQPTLPYDPAKGTAYTDRAQITTPSSSGQASGAGNAHLSEAQRAAVASQVTGAAATSGQAQGTTVSGQVPTCAPSSPVQSSVPQAQAQITVPPTPARGSTHPGQVQNYAPRQTTQGTAPSVPAQEQSPTPRNARARGTSSAGAANGRDQSPPPYSLTGSPSRSATHTMR